MTDTGAGIAVEDQKKLFGEFTQFNKNELQAGGKYVRRDCTTPLPLVLSFDVIETNIKRWIRLGSVDFQTHSPYA